MSTNYLKLAQRNLDLYIIIRIFAKRVFLPLTAIYFVETVGLSIVEIGILSAYFSIIQFASELPTGYFADLFGRLYSIRIGSLLAAVATFIYAFFASRYSIYVAVALEALGYAFLGGAGEALIHDSLTIRKESHLYVKYMSKNMSYSLIFNAILVALVTNTYIIDKRLPFALATICYLILFSITFFMHDFRIKSSAKSINFKELIHIKGKRYIALFGLSFGIIAALYTTPADTVNLALKEFGANPAYMGYIYGAASVFGFVLGYFIHHIQKQTLKNYLLIDLAILSTVYIAVTTKSVLLIAIFMIIFIGFWRYRRITFQHYLLSRFDGKYKATLVSVLNWLEQLNSIWLPIVITSLVSLVGMQMGFAYMFAFILAIAPIYYRSTLKFLKIM